MSDIIVLHKYYFTESLDCIKGLRPKIADVYSGDILSFSGPFISFDKQSRILQTEKYKLKLPEDQIETSKVPNLFERTKIQLQKLSN